MLSYPVLLTAHLFAAFIFVGTVFFEVLFMENIRKQVPKETMRTMEIAIGTRARSLIPWVLLILYGAGLGMAWHYRASLADPVANRFSLC